MADVRAEMAAASRRIQRVKRVDRVAVGIISLGGFAVVLSVIGILVFIGAEALPLFRAASVRQVGTFNMPAVPQEMAALGTDDTSHYLYDVTPGGRLAFFNPQTGAQMLDLAPPALTGATVTASSRSLNGDFVALGTSDGRAALGQVRFSTIYDGSQVKDVSAELVERGAVVLDPEKRPIRRISYVDSGDQKYVAAQVSERDLAIWWTDGSGAEHRARVQPLEGRTVTTLEVGRIGTVIAGTDRGEVYHWELGDGAVLTDVSPIGPSAVTALSYLIGYRTFVAGTADGHVSAWFRAPVNAEGDQAMVRGAVFSSQQSPITAIAASTRDRTFAAGSADGRVVLRHQTSLRTLAEIGALDPRGQGPVTHLVMTPRSDGLLVARAGTVDRYAVFNPHPEVSWRTLFGKVWYEGYAAPEYVWQSTGASDDFEIKLGLVPLIFGTIKGTFYALLFAIPLAVAGALYTSQFVHPSFRSKIKPTIEIMAALPSVVVGFIAGLYLAPVVERNLVAVGLLHVFLPLFGTLGFVVWLVIPGALRRRLKNGTEILVILPLMLLGAGAAVMLAPSIEVLFFGGDVRQWLTTTWGSTYDQRNSLVVGIAMGFAVIPIIFTVSEDAFSSVPSNLGAASLALGASRWQTAVRVILPTASPAVFSAIMIGFGRAIGETMIVLMATGNTPVMDWSIFNGFRTLSANLAVEIPEAPVGGTLYRTLFLAGALLFIMTFTLNTIAEVIRQRLRDRYRAI